MTNSTAAADWQVTTATMRGSAHGAHVPNQDAVRAVEVADGAGSTYWLGAVSDGHGGRRYVRSDVGSELAVTVALELVSARLQAADGGADLEGLLPGVVPQIVATWRDRIAAHLAEHPFTDDEAATAGAPLAEHAAHAYGATLLVAVVADAGVALAQIGDGDALIRTHGFAVRPVPGDDRLVAGETTSLCLDTAVDDFRFATLPESAEPDLILLASDGYGNSFADPDWWRTLVDDLAWFLGNHDFATFTARFGEWLGESALVGGDDVSAVVAARRPLVVPAAARPLRPPAEPAPVESLPRTWEAEDEVAVAVVPRRRGARRAAVIALVLALVGAGAGLLWFLVIQGDDGPPATVPDDSESSQPASASPSPTPTDKVEKKKKKKRQQEQTPEPEEDTKDPGSINPVRPTGPDEP